MMKALPWYARLVRKLGLAPHSWEARDAVQGTSKHGRAKTKRHDLERWRKRRRLMAAASRRRNRGQ